MRIEIINWTKYNPRADAKSGWSWWRFQNDFFDDPDFYEMSGSQVLVWIAVCCARSRASDQIFRINEKQIADRARTNSLAVRDAMLTFASLNKLKIHELNDTRTDPYVDVRRRTDPCSTDGRDETDETDETVAGGYAENLSTTPTGPVGPAALLITSTTKKKKKPQTDGSQVWAAYAAAYETAYGQIPPRNAKQNAVCACLVQRLGVTDACRVVGFYLTHRRAYYVQKVHQLECCLADCEGLRTQMLGGHRITSADAKMVDDSQTNEQTFAQVAANLRKKGWDV